MASDETKLEVASFAAHSARGLIRDRAMRRKTMLAAIVIATGWAIAGSTFLRPAVDYRGHPIWFILFWLGCAWVTVLALLLALYDVLAVGAQARAARRRLREEMARSSTRDVPGDGAGR